MSAESDSNGLVNGAHVIQRKRRAEALTGETGRVYGDAGVMSFADGGIITSVDVGCSDCATIMAGEQPIARRCSGLCAHGKSTEKWMHSRR